MYEYSIGHKSHVKENTDGDKWYLILSIYM